MLEIQDLTLKRNSTLFGSRIIILVLFSSYLSLLDIFHSNSLYLLFYLFELAVLGLSFFGNISYVFSKKYVPFIVYILFTQFSVLFNVFTGLSVMSIPKSLSILFIGFWCFVQLPQLLMSNKNLLKIYYMLPVVFGVISSLVSVLGILEINPFFGMNNFDEKFPVVFLRSSASFLFEPNVFAFTILIPLLFIGRLKISYHLRVIIWCILVMGLVSSYSRGAWMAYLIYLYFVLPQVIRYILFTVAGLFGISLFLNYYETLSSILVLDDILTGRPELWYLTLKNLNMNWFFGLGFDQSIINEFLIDIFHRNYYTTHNYFVDVLMTTGIFTLVSTVIIWILTFLYAKSKEDKAFLISVLFFLQFSPHNLGGASFIAIYLTSSVGMIWRKNLI